MVVLLGPAAVGAGAATAATAAGPTACAILFVSLEVVDTAPVANSSIVNNTNTYPSLSLHIHTSQLNNSSNKIPINPKMIY